MMELWNDIEKKKTDDAKKIKILFDWNRRKHWTHGKNIYVIGLYCVKYDLCLIKTTNKGEFVWLMERKVSACIWDFSSHLNRAWKQSTFDVSLCLLFKKYKWALLNRRKLSFKAKKILGEQTTQSSREGLQNNNEIGYKFIEKKLAFKRFCSFTVYLVLMIWTWSLQVEEEILPWQLSGFAKPFVSEWF